MGDREVEIDQALDMDRGWPMAVTDSGAVYPNTDGQEGAWSSVWFTDGGRPEADSRAGLLGRRDREYRTAGGLGRLHGRGPGRPGRL